MLNNCTSAGFGDGEGNESTSLPFSFFFFQKPFQTFIEPTMLFLLMALLVILQELTKPLALKRMCFRFFKNCNKHTNEMIEIT